MSKAFTKESDAEPEVQVAPLPSASLPPGARNYVTPDGAERMRITLGQMMDERASLGAHPEDADALRRLQALDQRIAQVREVLQSAEVTPPPEGATDRVCFGATVTVRVRGGEESVYRIVGVDEADPDRGWVSWLSPLARALVHARRGQRVRFQFPSGETELEVAEIRYQRGGDAAPVSS